MVISRTILTATVLAGLLAIQVMPQNNQKVKVTSAAVMNKSFQKMYDSVNALINLKSWKKLNKYAHPVNGFYVTDNPGVRPVSRNYVKFDELLNSSDIKDEIIKNKLAALKADRKNKLVTGKVPRWDCGTDKWNKKGAYCQDISSYPGLVESVLYSAECDENANHTYVVKAGQFSLLIKKHVVQTTGYDIYFAYIDGAWYIAVINVCDECSA